MVLTGLNGSGIVITVYDVLDLWDRRTYTEIKLKSVGTIKVKQTYTEVLNAIYYAKGGE